MSTAITILLRNNLHLTKDAIRTLRAQDVPVEILAVDNHSTDGTAEWLRTQRDIQTMHLEPALSVAGAWNAALRYWFYQRGADHALVINNDVQLRPDTARHLLADGGGFVTAVGTRDAEKIKPNVHPDLIARLKENGEDIRFIPPDPSKKRPHPDFSCFLIRRETFEKVGPFDEAFLTAFCEDADYHVRMQLAGIRAEALELPFLHYGSQTIKNASPVEARLIGRQADLNRTYFLRKHGFAVASPEYYAWFSSTPPVEEPTPSDSAASPKA